MKNKINFADFLEISSKLEIKSGIVQEIIAIKKSNMIQLMVDFGEDKLRSVVTNIKPQLGEDFLNKLLGKSFLFITNLEPVEMKGVESTAMIMPGKLEQFGIASIDSTAGNTFM